MRHPMMRCNVARRTLARVATGAMTAIIAPLAPLASAAQTDTYRNPVDGETYVAPGGWHRYQPSGGTPPTTGEKVSLASVRLLQSQEEIGSRTSVKELAAFVRSAHAAAAEVFASYGKPAVLLVQFTCTPGACPASLASQGDPPRELLQTYYSRLKALPPLAVTGEVKFQFTLTVQP
jgi:hypothetical protein